MIAATIINNFQPTLAAAVVSQPLNQVSGAIQTICPECPACPNTPITPCPSCQCPEVISKATINIEVKLSTGIYPYYIPYPYLRFLVFTYLTFFYRPFQLCVQSVWPSNFFFTVFTFFKIVLSLVCHRTHLYLRACLVFIYLTRFLKVVFL